MPGSGSAKNDKSATATQKSIYSTDDQYSGPTKSRKRIFKATLPQAIPSPVAASSKGSFSLDGAKVVHRRGYMRSDGTHAANYTRSLLTKSRRKSMAFAAVQPVSSVSMTATGDSTHQAAKCMKSPITIDHKLHPIPGMQSAGELIKKGTDVKPNVHWHLGLKKLDQQPLPLLDVTNTSHLPSSRVQPEQQKLQQKVTFKQRSLPLDVIAKCGPCPHTQTAVEGKFDHSYSVTVS